MSRKSRQRKMGVIGFVSVRIMAEYASSGLWLMRPAGVFRHSGIGADALNLPPELKIGFAQWIETYWGRLELEGTVFDCDSFNATGRELAHALKAHLGPESYVEFVPESNEGITLAEVIP